MPAVQEETQKGEMLGRQEESSRQAAQLEICYGIGSTGVMEVSGMEK